MTTWAAPSGAPCDAAHVAYLVNDDATTSWTQVGRCYISASRPPPTSAQLLMNPGECPGQVLYMAQHDGALLSVSGSCLSSSFVNVRAVPSVATDGTLQPAAAAPPPWEPAGMHRQAFVGPQAVAQLDSAHEVQCVLQLVEGMGLASGTSVAAVDAPHQQPPPAALDTSPGSGALVSAFPLHTPPKGGMVHSVPLVVASGHHTAPPTGDPAAQVVLAATPLDGVVFATSQACGAARPVALVPGGPGAAQGWPHPSYWAGVVGPGACAGGMGVAAAHVHARGLAGEAPRSFASIPASSVDSDLVTVASTMGGIGISGSLVASQQVPYAMHATPVGGPLRQAADPVLRAAYSFLAQSSFHAGPPSLRPSQDWLESELDDGRRLGRARGDQLSRATHVSNGSGRKAAAAARPKITAVADGETSKTPSTWVFVRGIGPWVTQETLASTFDRFGAILSVHAYNSVRGRATHKWISRNFAFLQFSTADQAAAALHWMYGSTDCTLTNRPEGLELKFATATPAEGDS